MRKYNKTTHTDDDILKALELISEVCDSLKNKRRIKRAAFSLDTPALRYATCFSNSRLY